MTSSTVPSVPDRPPYLKDGEELADFDAIALAKRIRRWYGARARGRKEARQLRRILALRAIVSRLPLAVAALLGEAVGRSLFFLLPSVRKLALGHLRIALGDELTKRERRRIGLRCLGLMGRGALSYMVLHRWGAERALTRLEVVGVENLDAGLADGKGCMCVAMHLAVFDLAASWLGTHRNGCGLGRPSRRRSPASLVNRMRTEMGCPTIERGATRELLRTLASGRPVAVMLDQDFEHLNGAFVPFFGRPAFTTIGPGTLSAKTGSPMVLSVSEWTGLTTHRLTFHPPMRVDPSLPKQEGILELTRAVTAAMEAEIRRVPHQWAWIHRRWETRPKDKPDAPRVE